SWTEFDNYGSASQADSSRILFARSTDHGLTWLQPVRVSDVGGNCIDEDNTVEGAVPTVGPNGEIYISWAGPLGLMFDKSTNGGVTFGSDTFVSDIPGGWDFSVPGISRCNGLPVTVCDTSRTATRGNVYVMWGDQRFGTDNSDVWVIKSTDGGSTWAERKRVNNDNTTRHQFFPWVSIDQTTGFLYFIFYDRRATTGVATDVYVARSTDGGETFDNFKVSQSSFSPNQGVFFGDYTNIASYDKKIYPIWMRMDGNSLSVWTALVPDTTNVPVELSSFTVETSGAEVILRWQTATELNNLGFEIEKKLIDDLSSKWISTGFIKGMGTTTEKTNYIYKDKPANDGKYAYRLKQVDYNGEYNFSQEVEVYYSSLINFVLNQNYPNPFNPSTTISYQMPKENFVSLKVFDVLGNQVAVLINEIKPAGLHEVNFDASKFGSGIYIYKMMVGDFSQSKRMILLK
ncbi:MAG: T9SS type A sorting domain-containing protein, partial [Ignavibacteriaceae bacterium]|nr:T9SS type A sorting domain-containing protein [Ignavibacteriaceae bacterium]